MRRLLALACVCIAPIGAANAATAEEFWPEASLYLNLSPATRLFLDLPYAKGMETGEGALELAGYLDVSLLPIGRPALQQLDWQRSRFLWARVGYDHIVKNGAAAEDRGVVSLWAKTELPEDIWIEGRARADLRWIGGEYSTRYRFRLEATREFTLQDHAVVPYANVEWFYDTHYDGWARTLYQAGAEFTLSEHFRFELYLARQNDHLPAATSLNALGVVAKWYY